MKVDMNDPTVYLLDDDPSQLRAYSRLIRSGGFSVVGFESAMELLAHVAPYSRGCLLLDYEMPEMTGLEVQQNLRRSGVHIPIVFLTAHGDIPLTVSAMAGGAINLLCKPSEADEILAAIPSALDEDVRFRTKHSATLEFAQRISLLTPREHEVMKFVVQGHLNKQIALKIGTVEKTVKVHRGRMMKKLRVPSLAELVRLYEQATHLNLSRKSVAS